MPFILSSALSCLSEYTVIKVEATRDVQNFELNDKKQTNKQKPKTKTSKNKKQKQKQKQNNKYKNYFDKALTPFRKTFLLLKQ